MVKTTDTQPIPPSSCHRGLSPFFCFDENCGGDNRNEENLHVVLDQGRRDAYVLIIIIEGVEVVAVDIIIGGVQSVANKTADEKNL